MKLKLVTYIHVLQVLPIDSHNFRQTLVQLDSTSIINVDIPLDIHPMKLSKQGK